MGAVQLTKYFGLGLLFPNQAQKDVVINTDLTQIDTLLQLSAVAIQNSPPVSPPADQTIYIVGTLPTGVWANNPNAVAVYQANGAFWTFYGPQIGWTVFNQTTGNLMVFTSSGWVILAAATNSTLGALASLTPTAGGLIVGTGTTWVVETPAQALGSIPMMYAIIFGG